MLKVKIVLAACAIFLVSSLGLAQDSLNVTMLSMMETDYAYNVVIAGEYAYVADGNEGLRVIDVSDPANPEESGSYDTPGRAHDVVVAGDYAYVADSGSGLRVIDITDPANPEGIGFCDTPDFAYSVAVSGGYAYVADREGGLRVIDISDPTTPVETGFYDTPTWANGVAVSGRYAYLAAREGGLLVIDINDPTTPVETGFCYTPDWTYGVEVSGDYAYVTDYTAGLRVIDISDPTNPFEVGFYDTPGDAEGVAVAGDYAYVAARQDGLRVIDVSDPANPEETGFYHTPNIALGVEVSGRFTYVADHDYFEILYCRTAIRPFNVVDPTGMQYLIVIEDATLPERDFEIWNEIGIFDGLMCVRATGYEGEFPLQISAWGAVPDQGLPGFTPGNTIAYWLWSWEEGVAYIAEPTYSQGNGEFGNGQFSQVTLEGLEGPVLSFPSYEYDFSIHAVNNEVQWELRFENTGLGELTITSVSTTDEHFSVEPAEITVPSLEEATVTITFTPTEAIEYEADIIFESNVPLHPEIAFPVRGEGYVLEGFDLSADAHDFERVPVETEVEWEFTVTNNVGELVEIGDIVSSDPAFTVSPEGMTLDNGEEATATVAFFPDDAIQYNGTITLSMIEPVQADFIVTVQGMGSEGLEVELMSNFFNLVSTCLVPENLAAEEVFDFDDLVIVYSHTGGF
ncbi:hypothetical protein K8I28_04385, partial [bacterium]|nr:hypothetical protein [bacterium]